MKGEIIFVSVSKTKRKSIPNFDIRIKLKTNFDLI